MANMTKSEKDAYNRLAGSGINVSMPLVDLTVLFALATNGYDNLTCPVKRMAAMSTIVNTKELLAKAVPK